MTLDPFGKVLLELRDDAAVEALTDRIRGHEPGPEDAKGPGEYIAFVVVSDLGGFRGRRGLPIQFPRVNVRAYADTYTNAKALYLACQDALHDVGQRVHANGLGIYASHDATGGTEGADPRTHQPYIEGVFELIATTTAVAA
jgi:hypothetical protein